MLKLNHKNLYVWKKSIELVKEVYRVTKSYPASERFGLVNQMQRSAISIPSNIAEGAARRSKKERIRFYEIARSSLVELDTQVEISIELFYLNDGNKDKIETLANEIFAMLSGMIKSNT